MPKRAKRESTRTGSKSSSISAHHHPKLHRPRQDDSDDDEGSDRDGDGDADTANKAATMPAIETVAITPDQVVKRRGRSAQLKAPGLGRKGSAAASSRKKLPLNSPVEAAAIQASKKSGRRKPKLPNESTFLTTEPGSAGAGAAVTSLAEAAAAAGGADSDDDDAIGSLLRKGWTPNRSSSIAATPTTKIASEFARKNRLAKPSSKRAQALLAAAGNKPPQHASASALLLKKKAKMVKQKKVAQEHDSALQAAEVASALEIAVPAPALEAIPLPAEFDLLLQKFEALDAVLTISRHIIQRTFASVRTQVERKTGRSFTMVNLGQIVALAPDMVEVTVNNVGETMQHVVAAKHSSADAGADGADATADTATADTSAAAVVRPEKFTSPAMHPLPQLQQQQQQQQHGGNFVNRAQQAADFKRRSQVFRTALVDVVKAHVAQQASVLRTQSAPLTAADIKQVPSGFDPELVPDIVPFNLPCIADYRSSHSSKALKSRASEASAASVASTTAAVLAMKVSCAKPKTTSLLERIRKKEKAKAEEDSFKNPNEKKIGQMALLMKEVLMLVWSKKPKNGKGCTSIAYTQLCADLTRKCRHTSQMEAESLVLLLVEEVKSVCTGTPQADEPWFRIEVVSLSSADAPGGTIQREYAKIDHKFEMSKVKRHLLAQSKALQAQAK